MGHSSFLAELRTRQDFRPQLGINEPGGKGQHFNDPHPEAKQVRRPAARARGETASHHITEHKLETDMLADTAVGLELAGTAQHHGKSAHKHASSHSTATVGHRTQTC